MRKGHQRQPAMLGEGDIIILPNGKRAVVTGRDSESSCTYRTADGEDGRIDKLTPDSYRRAYGYVDPSVETFTEKDIWYSKSVVTIDTPDNCTFCPFSDSDGHGKVSCLLMYIKSRETGQWEDITVSEPFEEKTTPENIEAKLSYRDKRCPLTDISPYQPWYRDDAASDFVGRLISEER